jgi:hypothetical protein
VYESDALTDKQTGEAAADGYAQCKVASHKWSCQLQTNAFPARFVLLVSALLALVAAMWAGLLRLDLELPYLQPALALSHGPLMVSGFLGTLISLERSVALNRPWAYGAPLLTALGTLGIIVGVPGKLWPLLITLGSLALVWNFAAIVRRQTALFTVTMALGAVAWLIGNIFWVSGVQIPSMVHWWVGFLVLTIVGERLELSRLAPRSPGINRLFLLSAGVFQAGLIWASLDRARGLQIAGAGLLLLSFWLARFDVARYTVRQPGLPRFIALHLLTGYFWLAVGGIFWTLAGRFSSNSAWQSFHYDAMLHSIFLGFVFSMIFAHAPIIFPAITGRTLVYRKALYAHGILLHLSVALRIGSDITGQFAANRWSGVLNVLAITVFIANTAYGVRLGGVPDPQRAAAARL